MQFKTRDIKPADEWTMKWGRKFVKGLKGEVKSEK